MVVAPRRPQLHVDLDVDVCVIGGGLAGLTTAREVARAGWSVVLIEAGRIAASASGRNTGFVLPGFGAAPDSIIARVGFAQAKDLWALAQSGSRLRPRRHPRRRDARDRRAGRLALRLQDRRWRRVYAPCRASRRIRCRNRRLADRTGARGAAQRALLSRHSLSAGDPYPPAQLCAGAGCRSRARRRAHLRAHAGSVHRSCGRAQAHCHAERAVAGQSCGAVRQRADRVADAAGCVRAHSGHDLCDHHGSARAASYRSHRLSRCGQRLRPCG